MSDCVFTKYWGEKTGRHSGCKCSVKEDLNGFYLWLYVYERKSVIDNKIHIQILQIKLSETSVTALPKRDRRPAIELEAINN